MLSEQKEQIPSLGIFDLTAKTSFTAPIIIGTAPIWQCFTIYNHIYAYYKMQNATRWEENVELEMYSA